MTSPTPAERDPARFNAAIRQLYAGGSNNTGKVTLRASQTTTVVNHQSCNPNSHISIMPLTASALTATEALSTKAAKIITLTRVLSVASGTVAYVGVGFKPSAVQFTANASGVGYSSWGGGDDGVIHNCFNALLGVSPFSAALQTTVSIVTGDNTAGTNYQVAAISSMDTDGFTLSWTKVGTPTATANITALCFPESASSTINGVRVSSRTTGSFTLTHPSNAATDQNFTYSITGGA